MNGKKVNIPSFALKIGNVISVVENKQKSKYIEAIREKLKNYKPQEWLELKADTLSGKVLSLPTTEDLGTTINTQLIVEHYSRI